MKSINMKEIIEVSKRGISSYHLSKENSGPIEVPVIGMKAVQEGYIDADSVEWVKMEEKDVGNKAKVESGDLILTIRGTSLKAAVANDSVDGYALSNNLIAFTLSKRVIPEVVAAYLNNPIGQRELHKRAGGTLMLTLNKKGLEQVPIPLISFENQEKIANFVQLSRNYRESLTKELELWDKMVESYLVEKMEV